MNKLFLFDVDGTLCISGQKISDNLANKINWLKSKNYEIGLVGGGKFETIIYQMNNQILFDHIFSESGSVYHKLNNAQYYLQYKRNIRKHKFYNKINILIKLALNYLSTVDYLITGNFIDLRNGLVYISLIGMNANIQEREDFMIIDREKLYRDKLLIKLKEKAIELEIEKKK
jgi:hydroxymethylpyrimidine pyrophosphatase-like HAD family hydrolase